MRATTVEPWKDVRKGLMSKWYDIRVFEEPCPYYMSIPTPFCHFSNVLPEEQEEIIFNELKVFLLGNQTENIRISEMDEHNLPAAIGVNISFDPYIRSELERFNDILIATATIKKCCYAITHDAVKFSPIGGTVASTIDRKVSDAVLNICNKLDGLVDASQQLNTLFREVHGINESLNFYSDIVKTIYVEQLIGGQVLTLLDSKRRHVFAGQAMQDLDDVFQAGWKIFAQYIGGLVCRFEADNLQYEFVIWSSKEMNEMQQKIMNVNKSMIHSSKSKRYVIVDALCPKFFTKYLDILVRCAEFGDASKTENSKMNGKSKNEKESVESVMEDVRNVDWSNLDVQTTVRMLVQFSRKESVCLLREITSATNVDQAIRDIHELLLKGSCAHEVVVQCIKADILQKPIDEVGKIRLKKLTHDILGTAAEKHHPFWKYFSFKIEKSNVFEMLGERMAAQRTSSESVLQNTIPMFFECISVSMNCPIDVEPIISKSAVFHLVPIFRIWIQLHVASWRIANSRDEVRGMMPSRSGSELAVKKHLMNALDWEVANLKQKWAAYVDVAISLYYSRIAKAVSLDEYNECQQILANDVTKMMGITEMAQLENIKDILNLIWSYDNSEIRLPDLIADFEEVQSRFRMGAAALA